MPQLQLFAAPLVHANTQLLERSQTRDCAPESFCLNAGESAIAAVTGLATEIYMKFLEMRKSLKSDTELLQIPEG